jgi:hypothetical protein
MEVFFGGVDHVVAQHLLHFIDGCAGLKQVLSVSVSEPICRCLQPGLVHGISDGRGYSARGDGSIGGSTAQEELSVFTFGPFADDVGGDGFDGALGQRKHDRLTVFSIFQCELSFAKGDIIEADQTDLFGRRPRKEAN